MTKEEFAAILHGREYGDEITADEEVAANAAGLVVVFGYSDDNVEFRGAINDEIGAYDGIDLYLTPKGKIKTKEKEGRKLIEALWQPEELDASWLIKTEIPHATFDIMEDGELFCRGIVFDFKDLQAS